MRTWVLVAALAAFSGSPLAAESPASTAGLKWSWHIAPSAQSGARDEVDLIFIADIAPGWILYSSDFTADLGPRPATFTFSTGDAVALVGPIEAVGSQKAKDRTWGTQYAYFAGRAEFRQKIRLSRDVASVDARVEGQTCHEADGLCELFKESLSVKVQRP